LQPLLTVSAHKDDGSIIMVPTRWSPRKVLCKEISAHGSASERLYAVKYRRSGNPASHAAAISEVVCHALLRMVGLRTLDAVLVEISPELARAYQQSGTLDFTIDNGLHFGTRLRLDFMPMDFAPGPDVLWTLLARPEELVSIWAADSWLMNLDRGLYGNILMEPDHEAWHLIPADQSDCLLGAMSFADGSYLLRSRSHASAPYLPMLERALFEKGPQPLQRMVGLIRQAANNLPEVMARVPPQWWEKAGVKPDDLMACLRQRADRIRALVELAKWEGIPYGPDGAIILDL
jgi:hypothetical protein